MAGLTPSGFVPKTTTEIYQTLLTKLRQRYGDDYAGETNTPEGVLLGIIGAEIADEWQSQQQIWNGSFPKTATDKNLDNCCDRVGVTRIDRSKSSTNLLVKGNAGSILPANAVVTVEGSNERFKTLTQLTLATNRFSEVTISITSVQATTPYTLTINNNPVTVVSSGAPTEESIIGQLTSALSSLSEITVTNPSPTTINIIANDPESELPLIIGARLTADEIGNLVTVEAENYGGVLASANTLINLLIPYSGINSVTNRVDALLGRYREEDEELRKRRYDSVRIIGASTNGAMYSNVRNLDGVVGTYVLENKTMSVDENGLPAKSFEVIVEGGDDAAIARCVWDYHPLGIESYGNTVRVIDDEFGIPRTVKYSRPEPVYIHAHIEYTRNLEEALSPNASNSIKRAFVTYGNSLNVGVDLMPQRFFDSIFESTTGIATIKILLARSSDGVNPGTYSPDPMVLGVRESAIFDINRVTVAEV